MNPPNNTENKQALQDSLTERLYKKLEARKDIVLTKTNLNGKYVIRFSVGSAWTEEKHVDAAYQLILDEARKVITEGS